MGEVALTVEALVAVGISKGLLDVIVLARAWRGRGGAPREVDMEMFDWSPSFHTSRNASPMFLTA